MNHYKAVFFDLNGTLIDICTDEGKEDVRRVLSHLLYTYDIRLSNEQFSSVFYDLMKKQRQAQNCEHSEFDVVGIFQSIIEKYGSDYTKNLSASIRKCLPDFLAHVYRSASMFRLELYPGVRQTLDILQKEYILAAVSDAQKIWAEAELRMLDLLPYFPVRIISSSLGIRKPSPLMFELALKKLSLKAEEVVFVGNDMYRDVAGAKQAGMACVLFHSNQGDRRDHGAKPDYVIYQMCELPTAIRFLEERI